MPRNIAAIIIIAIISATGAFALQQEQPKIPLTHEVYDDWKNLTRPLISGDGRWVSWEVNPQKGDGWLYLKDLEKNTLDSVPRGHRAKFSPNSNFMAFYVSPPEDVIRQSKVDGLSGDQLPRDSVAIYILTNSRSTVAGRAGSFAVPEKESDWMVYLLRTRLPVSDGQTGNDSIQPEAGSKSPKTIMFILNPVTGEEHEFFNVVEFSLSDNGRLVSFVQDSTVNVFNTRTRETSLVLGAPGTARSVITCSEGRRAAFLFAPGSSNRNGTDGSPENTNGQGPDNFPEETDTLPPTESQPEIYDLWYWEEGYETAIPAVTETTAGMPQGWSVSENRSISFSESGERLYFGTAETPQSEPEDTLLAEEKYRVDVWHYNDPQIQPQQLVELRDEQRRTYLAVYHTPDDKMVQLATPDIPDITLPEKDETGKALGISTLPYEIQNSFESGDYADIYLVDMNTGDKHMVLQKHRGSSHRSTLGDARLSPEGKYLIWYSQADSNWHAIATRDIDAMAAAPAGSTTPRPVVTSDDNPGISNPRPLVTSAGNGSRSIIAKGGTATSITAGIPVSFYDELYDQPSEAGPYGMGTWTKGDGNLLIYDRYDIWKIDPSGGESPVNLTNGYGRANGIRFRYINPDPDENLPGARDRIMLSAFNLRNKQDGFYSVRMHRPSDPGEIIMSEARYTTPQKAADAGQIIWRRSTFTEYADLWVSSGDFRNARKISNANPQQSRYRWGTAELVEWVSFNNDSLQGILYKPENMEAGKKYPMIVYFYERLSDNLYRHYTPSPSRSTVNMSYCVSNGYLVFVPDIPYTLGYPGQSSYNAIVSGTHAMLEQFEFIDRNNIGIQGQSWAGYQITWLITQTNMFRAAMAGAPVTNMTSAYGGIRWATGLSRIYQYEETQSRIGGTLWDKPLRYLENSPLFFADKVNTPLLMMHNDNDGAVPWYQGIEFFMALRRLGQPVWMLNYNNEAHNLTRRPNMMDLSVRMYQFFDHYLKGKPAPVWMTDGIPALEKGKTDGYELAE